MEHVFSLFVYAMFNSVLALFWWLFFGRKMVSTIRFFFILEFGFTVDPLVYNLQRYRVDGVHDVSIMLIVGMLLIAAWVAVELSILSRRLRLLENPAAAKLEDEEKDPDKDLFDNYGIKQD